MANDIGSGKSSLMILPDHLAPKLRLVICGTAASDAAAACGHYYAGPGNKLWEHLFLVGLTPVCLTPREDATILRYGIGLTDVAKQAHGMDGSIHREAYDAEAFVVKMSACRPGWIAFHGKTSAKVVSKHLGRGSDVAYGEQAWGVAEARVFVLPSSSGANRRRDYEGRPDRLSWFEELARVAGFITIERRSP
jgi:TDG/mug DNA glycosylase family protein